MVQDGMVRLEVGGACGCVCTIGSGGIYMTVSGVECPLDGVSGLLICYQWGDEKHRSFL